MEDINVSVETEARPDTAALFTSDNATPQWVPNSSIIEPGTYKVHCKSEGTYKTAVLNVKGQIKDDGTPVICWTQLPRGGRDYWHNDEFKIESVEGTDKYTLTCEATGTVLTAQDASGHSTYPIVMSKRRAGDSLQEWRFRNYAGGYGEPGTYRIVNARDSWLVTLDGGNLASHTPIVGQPAFPDYKPMQGWTLDKQ